MANHQQIDVAVETVGTDGPKSNGAPRSADLWANLMQTEQNVTILLGETQKDIGTVLNWTEGSLIEVDTIPGQPIDVMVNDRLCFRGTVVVGEHFGIQIDEILGSDESV